MTIQGKCEKCGRTFRVGDKFAGRKVKCKGCGEVMVFPELGAEGPAPKGALPKADAPPPEEKAKDGESAPPEQPKTATAGESADKEDGEGKGEEKTDKKAPQPRGKRKTGKITAGKKAGDRVRRGKDTGKKTARKKRGETTRAGSARIPEEKKSHLTMIVAGCAGLFMILLVGVVIVLVVIDPWGSDGKEKSGEATPSTGEDSPSKEGDEAAKTDEEPSETPSDEESPGQETGEEVKPGDASGEEPGEEPGEEVAPGERPGEEPGDETPPVEPPDEEPGDETPPVEPPDEEPGDETPPVEPPDEEPGDETPPVEPPDEEPGDETPPVEPPDEEPGEEVEPGEERPEEPVEPPKEDPRETALEKGRQLMDALRTSADVGDRAEAAAELGQFLLEMEKGELAELEEECFQALIEALKDSGGLVRANVATALGKIKDDRAVSSLIEGLKDDDEEVRTRSAEALREITGADLGVSFENWTIWKETGIDDLTIIEGRRGKYRDFTAKAEEEESRGEGSDPKKAKAFWEGALEAALTADEKTRVTKRIEALSARIDALRSELDGLFNEAKAALDAGKTVKAQTVCEKILEKDPEHPGARELVASLTEKRYRVAMDEALEAEKMKNWDGARGAYEKALAIRPDDPEASASLARLASLVDYGKAMDEGARAEETRDWKAARAAYERALEVKPGDEEAGKGLEKARMAPVIAVLARHFVLPPLGKDRHGNPVVTREGSRHDPVTGLPAEIWLKKPSMEFVLVPPGEFSMGSPEEEFGRGTNEGPVRRVVIRKPFYMGKYEVTQSQWLEVMGGDAARFPDATHPLGGASWTMGKEFTKKLAAMLGASADSPLSIRFPSEAQWEYAARAGTTTQFGFGDTHEELGAFAWFTGNSGGKAHPVGTKKPNALGLYDMHGNVAEWVEDLVPLTGYEGAPQDGSVWTVEGEGNRVVRGGCWMESDLRSACRMVESIKKIRSAVGFRLYIWPDLED